MASLACLLVLVLGIVAPIRSEVIDIDVRRTDLKSALLGRFGFTSRGSLQLNVSHLSIFSPEKATAPDTYSMGFVLVPQHQIAASGIERMLHEQEGNEGSKKEPEICPLTSPNVTKIFNFMEMEGPADHGERPMQTTTVQVNEPGLYSVYLINCAAPARLISCHVSLSMYNREQPAPGSTAPGPHFYLPAGAFALIIVHAVCSAACIIIFIIYRLRLILNDLQTTVVK